MSAVDKLDMPHRTARRSRPGRSQVMNLQFDAIRAGQKPSEVAEVLVIAEWTGRLADGRRPKSPLERRVWVPSLTCCFGRSSGTPRCQGLTKSRPNSNLLHLASSLEPQMSIIRSITFFFKFSPLHDLSPGWHRPIGYQPRTRGSASAT